ncbi:hypothetical protein J2S25_001330 [Mesobacillus stamsii]|uniref:Uncharacterized protein n=1 Tax=Mesobacillus stamsii TaxID=225347 RepID=A0ABU0FUX2_9BACI|nr:hypothetical protein [Mesobacillus stamsii]
MRPIMHSFWLGTGTFVHLSCYDIGSNHLLELFLASLLAGYPLVVIRFRGDRFLELSGHI